MSEFEETCNPSPGVMSVCQGAYVIRGAIGRGLGRVCLGLASSEWVLHCMQERFHNRHPGDFKSGFIKVGESESLGGGKKKSSHLR